ncbi:hypothetical protein RCL_jg22867.t1 [Rhizophagus clarus]|uniref:Uncharacterized protein n=1 Tax=Rhizophagus clarus TaxID=94130 RepID=A0A8H3QLV7_9GLOM|nr:hypothetical protein RCL_jg22867.t1 [Rhizophagus clarus]
MSLSKISSFPIDKEFPVSVRITHFHMTKPDIRGANNIQPKTPDFQRLDAIRNTHFRFTTHFQAKVINRQIGIEYNTYISVNNVKKTNMTSKYHHFTYIKHYTSWKLIPPESGAYHPATLNRQEKCKDHLYCHVISINFELQWSEIISEFKNSFRWHH